MFYPDYKTNEIVTKVAEKFNTFGGASHSDNNPLAAALKDCTPMFAAGVSVSDVVHFIVRSIEQPNKE